MSKGREERTQSRRGRKPSGVKLVDNCEGSELARKRFKVIHQTISGELSVVAACETLGINEAAFYKLRSRFLSESLELLEPRKVGRKSLTPEGQSDRIEALEAEVRELTFDVEASRVRAEIALTMPELLLDADEIDEEDAVQEVREVREVKKKGPVRIEEKETFQKVEQSQGQESKETSQLNPKKKVPRREGQSPVMRRVGRFASVIFDIAAIQTLDSDSSMRGEEVQMAKREAERNTRKTAVAMSRWGELHGQTVSQIAGRIGIRPRLLYDWNREWSDNRLEAAPLGRKPLRVTESCRREINDLLEHLGPLAGVGTLLEYFPCVARREMAYLVGQFRQRFYEGKTMNVEQLIWEEAGSVWAMDYTTPPLPIDGIYKKILDVRDLGSGNQLASLSAVEESGTETETAMLLESLFVQHGAPLLIKIDNGSTLIAKEVKRVADEYGVVFLLSPPYYPQYNGACEAGHGSIKTRAHHIAARAGRPGQWTCDDLEAARVQANELSRPKGHGGPSPKKIWEERKSVSDRDRREFRKQIADNLRKIKDDANEVETDNAAKKRLGISRALVKLGYLLVRRRRIPLRNKSA